MKSIPTIILLGVLLIAMVGFQNGLAQNLLPNPGFETYSACPNNIGQVSNATGWSIPFGHSGNPDFHHVCATNPWVQITSNAFGSQTTHSGNAYVGLNLYYQAAADFREYITCPLTPAAGLTAGTSYKISWWVSVGDQSYKATDALQFYFSCTAPTWIGNSAPMTTYVPQCEIPAGAFLSDKIDWFQVTATFTATGGEKFLTIGNFKDDAHTTVINNGVGSFAASYIYFDDGSLVENVLLSADLQHLNAAQNGRSVDLTWETLSEVGNSSFEVERSVADYNHFEKIGTQDGAGYSQERLDYVFVDHDYTPGQMNYYRLKVLDQNGEFSYSNAVGVMTSTDVENLVSVYPVPANANTPIEVIYNLEETKPIHLLLVDLQGRTVRDAQFEGTLGVNHLQLSTNNLAAGEYLMRIHSGQSYISKRIVLL